MCDAGRGRDVTLAPRRCVTTFMTLGYYVPPGGCVTQGEGVVCGAGGGAG